VIKICLSKEDEARVLKFAIDSDARYGGTTTVDWIGEDVPLVCAALAMTPRLQGVPGPRNSVRGITIPRLFDK